MKTYIYKIKPKQWITEKFSKWIDVCRFVYNCAKERKEWAYKYGHKMGNYDLQKEFTQCKKALPHLNDVGCDTLLAIFDRLDKSFKAFFKGGGYPKWAAKKKWHSIPFKSITEKSGNSYYLPKFGEIRVFKSRPTTGKLKTANIIKEADGLYLHIVTDGNTHTNIHDNQVGIDMGITYFCVTSDGDFIENMRHYKKYEDELRVENRALARKKKKSKNREKQIKRLARLHQTIARVRLDFLHKISTKMARYYSVIFCEDLNIAGMSKNKKLSKHILDVSWGKFFELLANKTTLVKVPAHHTSQECSKCGHTCKENRKTQSIFECQKCGHTDNADLDAAKVILERGQSLLYANVGH